MSALIEKSLRYYLFMGMTFVDSSGWKQLLKHDLSTYHKSRFSQCVLFLGGGFSVPSAAAFPTLFTLNYDALVADWYEALAKVYRAELAKIHRAQLEANAGARQLRLAINKALAKALAVTRATARALLELMIGTGGASGLCALAFLERNLTPSGNLDNQRGWLCTHGPRPPRRELKAAGVLLQQVYGRVHIPLAA